jgi:integrase
MRAGIFYADVALKVTNLSMKKAIIKEYLKYYCADCEQDFNIVDKPEGTDYRDRLEVKEPYQPTKEYAEPPKEKPPSLLSKCITALMYLAIIYALVWYLGWDQVEGWLEKLVHVMTKMLGG